MPSRQPDWAGLPLELWHRALLALYPTGDDQLQWWRQLAATAAVCRFLREAVLGPAAGPLWRVGAFTSSHPGLSAVQLRQLNRLLASQGQHARGAIVVGGGWDLEELQGAAASLTGPHEQLCVGALDSTSEADLLGRTLLQCPVRALTYHGSCIRGWPASLQSLDLRVFPPPGGDRQGMAALVTERVHTALQQLQALGDLTSLKVLASPWCLRQADVACLARLPRLESLELVLYVSEALGAHAVEGLTQLASCTQLVMELIVMGVGLVPLLQSLRSVPLVRLTIECADSYVLTPADEGHLALCSISEQLTLCTQSSGPAERLQRLLPDVKLVHLMPRLE